MHDLFLRVFTIASISAMSLSTAAQCGSVDRSSPAAVAAEVDRIYNVSLDRMEHTLPSGQKVVTWIPPDDSFREQIGCLGPAAAPEIVELLHNGHRSFGHHLTIRMLGWAGGPDIVPPIAEILSRTDALQFGFKSEALESLASAPPDKALPVIEVFLRSEKNKLLLDQAKGVAEKLRGQ